jgi:prevent-host-death family protein
MLTVISLQEVENRFGEVIRRVYRDGETFIVERDGLPVVMIVPVREGRVDERYFLEFSRRLGHAARRQGLTEEQLLRELEEDRRALYRETYGATAPA